MRRLGNYKLSSCYQLNGSNYLLVKTCEAIPESNLLCNLQNLSIAEHELYKWASSELTGAPEFISYEIKSYYSPLGRQIIAPDGNKIYRTFEYLADIFAILNYTADSFSDGGRYNTPDSALKQTVSLLNSGATIIDLGVESTRPDALALSGEEEIKILTPLLSRFNELKQQYKFSISIDTYHSLTVNWLLDKDIDYINDVSGSLPLDLLRECVNSGKRYVAMHSLSVPASRELILPAEVNVVEYIRAWIEKKISLVENAGIDSDKIIFDPGIGFGKSAAQSWQLIKNIKQLTSTEILLGHSRKSFLNHIIANEQRDMATAIIAAKFADQVDYLRLHEVNGLNNIYPVMRAL